MGQIFVSKDLQLNVSFNLICYRTFIYLCEWICNWLRAWVWFRIEPSRHILVWQIVLGFCITKFVHLLFLKYKMVNNKIYICLIFKLGHSIRSLFQLHAETWNPCIPFLFNVWNCKFKYINDMRRTYSFLVPSYAKHIILWLIPINTTISGMWERKKNWNWLCLDVREMTILLTSLPQL